ncbi:hypothetical protein [Saccharopolyspora gregorii]|uniref:PE domain-containing protein n=1 Tax=Saccharopolyspora gregorii TaxID=33914 RepID=A0ABP6RYD5_9PSEU
MATINTTVNNGGVTSGASFSVDTDAIPGMIAKYEDARDELDKILAKAQRMREVEPPGDDPVSGASANAIRRLIGGEGEGGLSQAVSEAKKHLQGQIDQLNAALQDYRSADEAATPNQA